MALGDSYNLVGTAGMSGEEYPPAVGHVVRFGEGPLYEPTGYIYFEITAVDVGQYTNFTAPVTMTMEQLSEGDIGDISTDEEYAYGYGWSDYEDVGGYGGSDGIDWSVWPSETIEAAVTNAEFVRMIPFIYSADIAYKVEMGHEYMRFYYEDAVLLDGGSEEVWLATPYDQDDLLDIHFDQVGDTLRLTHAAYAPMLLSRTSTTSFTLTEIPFERGPFLLRNDLLDPFNPSTVTMQSSVIAKNAVGTLTCSRPYFVAGHVGALMKIWHPLPSDASQNAAASKASLKNTGTKTSYSIRGKGTMQFQTTGTWKGSVTVYRSYDEGITWDEFRPAFESLSQGGANHTLTWEENDPNTQYRMMSVIASQSGDSGFGATLKRYDTLHGGICRITAVNSTTEAAIIIVSALASTDATRKWAEGAWSTLRGFPASLTFFGGRAIYAGSISQQDPMAGLDYPQLRNMPG